MILKRLPVLLILILSVVSLRAQKNSGSDVLQVGIAGSPPFYFQNDSLVDGISAKVWEELAVDLDILFEYKKYGSIPAALDSLRNGAVDMVVGPVSIVSPRIEEFDFSQPYYISSLSILSDQSSPSLWQRIKPFISMKFFYALGIFLLVLSIVGFLFWIAEKRVNPEEFSSNPVKGIGSGIWLALVTMTTVGYGDKAPQTIAGRIISGSWMVISLLSATSLVAGIASVLTLSLSSTTTIKSAEDLEGHKVAVLANGPARSFVTKNHGVLVPVDSLEAGIKALENDKVDALVYDTPALEYYNQDNSGSRFKLSDKTYRPQGYGFAYRKDAPFVKKINTQLLRLRERGGIDDIASEWLKSADQ